MCAFSHVGPWASRRGFDTVVQTVSGITTRQAELFPGANPGPQFYPVSAIDYLTGYLMAFGAMVALAPGRSPRRRSRSLKPGTYFAGADRPLAGRSRVEVPESAPARDVGDKELYPAEIARWSIQKATRRSDVACVIFGPTVRARPRLPPPYWARLFRP